MEPIDCPETSLRNYHSLSHKISKELRSHLHRGGSQKSHIIPCMLTGAIWLDKCPRKYRREISENGDGGGHSNDSLRSRTIINLIKKSYECIYYKCLLSYSRNLHFFSNLSHFEPFPKLTLCIFKFACNTSSHLRLLPTVSKSGPSGM